MNVHVRYKPFSRSAVVKYSYFPYPVFFIKFFVPFSLFLDIILPTQGAFVSGDAGKGICKYRTLFSLSY